MDGFRNRWHARIAQYPPEQRERALWTPIRKHEVMTVRRKVHEANSNSIEHPVVKLGFSQCPEQSRVPASINPLLSRMALNRRESVVVPDLRPYVRLAPSSSSFYLRQNYYATPIALRTCSIFASLTARASRF